MNNTYFKTCSVFTQGVHGFTNYFLLLEDIENVFVTLWVRTGQDSINVFFFFFFTFAATVLGVLIAHVWNSHSRPPIGCRLTIREEWNKEWSWKLHPETSYQKGLHCMASDKCAQSFCSQKGSKSASHRFLLIFTHTWISPNPGATRTNGLGELDSFVFFFLKKYSTIYAKGTW